MEVFDFGIFLSSTVFMILYFLVFLVRRFSYRVTLAVCVLSAFCVIAFESVRIFCLPGDKWTRILVSAVQALVLQGTALYISEERGFYALFVGLSASNFVMGGGIVSNIVLFFTKDYILGILVGSAVNALGLMWLAVSCRRLLLNKFRQGMTWQICLIPCSCYAIVYLLLDYPRTLVEDMLIVILFLIILESLYILIAHYIDSRQGELHANSLNQMYAAYARGLDLREREIEETRQELRILRHDERHRDGLLLELLRQQRYEEAKSFLEDNLETLEETRVSHYCENIFLNSILTILGNRAEQKHIRLCIRVDVPEKLPVDERELSIAMANLLENALCAVEEIAREEERRVEFALQDLQGEKLLLEMKNPCPREILFSRVTGLPLSGKGGGHGFGMMSVQRFVQRYGGQMDCYQKDGQLVVRILIPLPGETGR